MTGYPLHHDNPRPVLPRTPCGALGPYPGHVCVVTTPAGDFIHDPERPDRTAHAFGVRLEQVAR